jgi:hypothetical protein
MNESAYCYGRLCLCVCLSVCDVRESRPEFWTEDLRVGRIKCSIHLVIRHTKPDKKIHLCHFHFQFQMWRRYGKTWKCCIQWYVNSAVWIAVRFRLIEHAELHIRLLSAFRNIAIHRCSIDWKVPLKACVLRNSALWTPSTSALWRMQLNWCSSITLITVVSVLTAILRVARFNFAIGMAFSITLTQYTFQTCFYYFSRRSMY